MNIGSDKRLPLRRFRTSALQPADNAPRTIIAYNKATGEIRSGQIEVSNEFDYYIIKLDGISAKARFRKTENCGCLECSFSLLVKECGINIDR